MGPGRVESDGLDEGWMVDVGFKTEAAPGCDGVGSAGESEG